MSQPPYPQGQPPYGQPNPPQGQPPYGQQYGQPPYGQPPQGQPYGAPPQGQPYGQPPQGGSFGQPPQGGSFGAPPQGAPYGAPPQGQPYGQQPPPGYGAPPYGQQQPYGQAPYGQQPYGQQPYGQPYGAQPTSSSLTPTAAIVIAYVFSFIGALIVLAMEKQNSLVRFHAMQAFIFGLINLVVRIVLGILTAIFLFTSGVWWIFNTLGWLLWLAYLGVTIWMIVEGINGRRTKIPVVGDYAEKYAPTFMR